MANTAVKYLDFGTPLALAWRSGILGRMPAGRLMLVFCL